MNPTFSDKIGLDNYKQREYLKQQHQLRNMTKASPVLSADDMIENLLSKKEIFQKKKDTNQQHTSASKVDPVWLTEGNEPAAYHKIWDQVCMPTGLTDTPKLSSILLGSGLGTDTLGYIWSLTNVTVSGALTKIELYRTLALISLAQKGYSFTNLLVLGQFSEAPIPRLDLRPSFQFLSSSNPQSAVNSTAAPLVQSPPPIQVPTVTETLSLMDTLSELVPAPITSARPTTSLSVLSATDLNKLSVSNESTSSSVPLSNTEDDDFDDFKSADIFITDSLTVLDVKDSSLTLKSNNSLLEGVNHDELFIKNISSVNTTTSAHNSKLFDDVPITEEDEEKKKIVDNNSTNNTSKNGVSTMVPNSLHEALREDLTLAPVSLSCIQPCTSNSAPVESDRYNALRQLSATTDDYPNDSGQEDLYDDFGDFITASHPASATATGSAQSSLLQPDIQEKCLEACVHVLREANDLFKSIDDSKVLSEVIGDDRGKKYLEEIVEVERIGRRIISSKTLEADDCELSEQLKSLCKALEPFTKPLEYTHMEEENGAKCGLCQCEIGPAHVKYGINQFHAPCANLFLHVTGELLPLTPVT